MSNERLHELRKTLLTAYKTGELWGDARPQAILPEGLTRGDEQHLIFLTLVYAISGGRDSAKLWSAARQAFAVEPSLFDPKTLAYAQPQAFVEPLQRHKLSKKRKVDGVTWHKIGKAIMMRGQGSVKNILAQHNYDAQALLTMLTESKTTFPHFVWTTDRSTLAVGLGHGR